jgi:dephospho-CoA kinase
MIWVGLSGGIGSGKSTAAAFLREEGYSVIDADQIAKDVVQKGTPGLASVEALFGKSVLDPDGSLDRKKMAELVFTNPKHLQQLEGIIHPLVQSKVAELKAAAEKRGEKIAFYDVPLLFEKNMQKNFDVTLLISCSEQTQRARLRSRNLYSNDEIDARLQSQIPLWKKQTLADQVIRNESSLQDLKKNLQQVVRHLLLQKA